MFPYLCDLKTNFVEQSFISNKKGNGRKYKIHILYFTQLQIADFHSFWPRQKICFPQYFGLTRRYLQIKIVIFFCYKK